MDRSCRGEGATHFEACPCREAYFERLKALLIEFADFTDHPYYCAIGQGATDVGCDCGLDFLLAKVYKELKK